MAQVTARPPGRPHVKHKVAKKASNGDKLLSFITQLTVLALWKSLAAFSAPVARLLAFYMWAGKSTLKVTSWVQRVLLKVIGWLGSPAFTRTHWLRAWARQWLPLEVRKWHVAVAILVTVSLIQRLLRKWHEQFDERLKQIRHVQERMQHATSYPEWRAFAQQLDRLGHSRGGHSSSRIKDNLYDRKLLQQKLVHLQRVREHGNVKEMMFALRSDLIRNIANIAKSQLHEYYYEVPAPIQEYISEVKTQLAMLTDWPEAGVSVEEKLAFFKETRHAYGRTALLLSGGGGLGSFHIGVVKALFEHRMLPRVLAGSSVGSIVAGIVATRTDAELSEVFSKLEQLDVSFFNNSRAIELVHSFLQKGALHDMSFLQRRLKALLGNYTFLEAYERTGRILNVSVCPADTNEPARLLNYLTAPQALIWSAVAASSAFPGLFAPQDLLARNAHGEEVRFSAPSMSAQEARRWRDGSLELDLPTFLLAEMFNCNHFIVSQTNPHIVPLLNLKKTMSRKWANLMELELRHRCAQMQWLLPDWMPTKWLGLFTQPWEGDITLVLPASLWNLGKTMVNPTTEDVVAAARAGELAVWEKLSAVESNCAIEAALDACLARLSNKVRERPLGGLSSRIPSWLSMNTIGQKVVASWGNPFEVNNSLGAWGPGGVGGQFSPSQAALHPGGFGALAGACSEPRLAAAAAAAAAALNGQIPSYSHHHQHLGSLHEGMADEQPIRVASWGSNGVADSVLDFPAADMGGYGVMGGGGGSGASSGSSGLGYGPGGSSSGRASSSHSPTQHLLSPTGAAAALLAGGAFGGGRSRLATRSTPIDEDSAMASDLLCSPDCGGGMPVTPDLDNMSSVSSGDSSGAAAARALRQLECCDSSAMLTDIWSSLLPLASSTLVLEAAAENNSLDVIAP